MSRVLLRVGAPLVCAVGAVLLAQALLRDDGPAAALPPKPAVAVRVAAQDLAVGTFLDQPEAPFKGWSEPVAEEMVREGAAPEQDVIGAVIIAPIKAGEPIRRGKLLMPGQDGFLAAVLRPGMRAVSVAVDAVSGNAGLIFPGDRVDVLLTQSLERLGLADVVGQRWASETILENVRVIAVNQNLKTTLTDRDPEGVARTMTLEVSREDAQKVALAADLGTLSLSLRSLLVDEAALTAELGGGSPAPARAPTWATDVSSVARSIMGQPAAAAPAAAAPPPPPPMARKVRILRGSTSETVEP